MTRFDVIYTDSKGQTVRKNMLAGDMIDYFNSLPWQESFQDCFKTEDAVYDYSFSVTYIDTEQLEQTFDIDFCIDDEKYPNINQSLRFDICIFYGKYIIKKVFFGLFGKKKEVANDCIIIGNQDVDNTLKCLNAFVRFDIEYLKKRDNDFGANVKDSNATQL